MDALFFVHIPKTAGTSFRKSAEAFFGVDNVIYDYSKSSPETSPLILDKIYKSQDFFFLKNFIEDKGVKFLSGHVNAVRYVHLFGSQKMAVFLRDPIQRIVSEYNHFVRHYGYKGDFASFYRSPQFVNRQSKMLHGIPIESIGFVGLTEHYESSLKIFNRTYGVNVKSLSMNIGRSDKSVDYELPNYQLEELRALNKNDFHLYSHVKCLFLDREKVFLNGQEYVYGKIQEQSSTAIAGWSWWQNRHCPVNLLIEVDNVLVAKVQAKELRPSLLRFNVPRLGYVGFTHNFSKPIAKGSVVTVKVAETGQRIS